MTTSTIRTLSTALLALGLAAAAHGCAMSNRAPVTGFIYNGAAGSENVNPLPLGTKSGQACAQSVLGMVGYGDASVDAAAKAGGITQISHVDTTNMSVLGVYAEACTVVYGT